MNELRLLLQENLNRDFISAVLSNPRVKEEATKIKVRPLMHKDRLVFQVETFRNNQAFHENLDEQDACDKLMECMQNMKQMQFETVNAAYTVLISKKGKVTIKKKAQKKQTGPADLSHNRKKKYILEEGTKVPFLQDLGVMT